MGAADASVPALPATSLVSSLTYPECQAAPATEIPSVTPPLAYIPDLAAAAIPRQETAGAVRRPAGLAACEAAAVTPPAGSRVAGQRSGRQGPILPATGQRPEGLPLWGSVAAALGAALLWVRRRGSAGSGRLSGDVWLAGNEEAPGMLGTRDQPDADGH